MRTLNELTEDQFKSLLDEYYAKPEVRSKLTPEEVKDIAKRLNKKIDVPIIRETKEEKILVKIVMKVDNFLYDNLPNEFYDLVRSLDEGIDDSEAKRLIKRLSKLANKKVDIPYLPEAVEYVAIRLVIGVIINSARKDWDIYKAQNVALDIEIPHEENASDAQLESIII